MSTPSENRAADVRDLRAVYVSALAEGAPSPGTELEDELRARIALGREAWPALALDSATYVRHLALHATSAMPLVKYAADLWLACACATGERAALAAFDETHGAALRRALERVSRAGADETKQAVLVLLFVGEPGRRPRIADYGGRASLRTWVTTVAVNAALNRAGAREERRHEPLDSSGVMAVGGDLDLALTRAKHGGALEEALRDALAALDDRRRTLLRLHHARGWSVDRLATMYRVSRSAAGRLLVDARAALLHDTKRRLSERTKLTPEELESLIVELQSQLHVSLVRRLGE